MNFNHSYFNIFVTLFVTLNFQNEMKWNVTKCDKMGWFNTFFMKKTYKRVTALIPKSDVDVIEHLNKQKSDQVISWI